SPSSSTRHNPEQRRTTQSPRPVKMGNFLARFSEDETPGTLPKDETPAAGQPPGRQGTILVGQLHVFDGPPPRVNGGWPTLANAGSAAGAAFAPGRITPSGSGSGSAASRFPSSPAFAPGRITSSGSGSGSSSTASHFPSSSAFAPGRITASGSGSASPSTVYYAGHNVWHVFVVLLNGQNIAFLLFLSVLKCILDVVDEIVVKLFKHFRNIL
uniref:Uncharacterized protein n=1 Tax=Aegilops tauschii subsp. strangulata TaxID=200361 RepID=A0A453NCK3_AEGTS